MEEVQSEFVAAVKEGDTPHIVELSAAGANPTSSWGITRWHGTIETAKIDYLFVPPVSYMQSLLDVGGTTRSISIERPRLTSG